MSGSRSTPVDGRAFAPELVARGGRMVREGNVRFAVWSPAVGLWRGAPVPGSLVSPGTPLGSLEVLGVLHRLIAPPDVHGIVVESEPRRLARRPVQFGDLLLRLDPAVSGAAVTATASESTDTGPDGLVFRAPSSGRYYARPSPDRDPFVRIGDIVTQGETVALIEVMKTFHRLAYGGDELPARAKVVHLFPKDGDDVEMGDPLVRVEPAT